MNTKFKRIGKHIDVSEEAWTTEQRQLFGQHLHNNLLHLGLDPEVSCVLMIQPERAFLEHPNPIMKHQRWSVHDGWSVWIRETVEGRHRTYWQYLDDAIAAAAESMAVYQYHAAWKERSEHFHAKAHELGLPYDEPPAELARLFAKED